MGNQKELKEENKKPANKFKAGAISATVWENKGKKDNEEFVYFSVSIDRNYIDSDKVWKKTSSMRVNDLPKVALVATEAYKFLIMKKGD